jgi:glycosyltransferase involved in cell wall biosynthesis
VSEVITDGFNGLLLRDPTNAVELAGLISRLIDDPSFSEKLAGNALSTARSRTLDDNAAAMWELLNQANARRCASVKE